MALAFDSRVSNDPPDIGETLEAWRRIGHLEREINNISERLVKEEYQYSQYAAGIFSLRTALLNIKDIIKFQDTYVTAVENIQNTLSNTPDSWTNAHVKGDEQSFKVCVAFKSFWSTKSRVRLNLIRKEFSFAKEEAVDLLLHAQDLREEHERCRGRAERSAERVFDLKRSKSAALDRLRNEKSLLRSVRRVPEETWIHIFKLCIKAEVDDYLAKDGITPLRSTPLALSKVCRLWRKALIENAQLWSSVGANGAIRWSTSQCSRFSDALLRAPSTVALYSDLATPKWAKSLATKPRVPEETSYSLHLCVDFPNMPIIPNLAFSHPFRTPTSLTLLSQHRSWAVGNSRLLDAFPSIRSLTFTNCWPDFTPPTNLAPPLKQLTILRFDVWRFPELYPGFSRFLTTNLEELNIRHGFGDANLLATDVTLPKLRVLGITYPGTNLLSRIKAPRVERLIVYCPKDRPLPLSIGETGGLRELRILKLVDWETYYERKDSVLAVDVCRMVAASASKLHTLIFFNSFVDGEALVEFATIQMNDTGRRMQEIILDDVRGTTRFECERLKPLVDQLKIHVY